MKVGSESRSPRCLWCSKCSRFRRVHNLMHGKEIMYLPMKSLIFRFFTEKAMPRVVEQREKRLLEAGDYRQHRNTGNIGVNLADQKECKSNDAPHSRDLEKRIGNVRPRQVTKHANILHRR